VERCLAAEEIEGLPVQGVEPVEWLPVSQLAARADYVTLHVPLEEHGPDATRGMAGANFFDTMKPGAVFLNTCRGDVMDTGDLKRALAADRLGGAVIDTWQDEPSIDRELLNQVGIGTPHIAGYSWEGRVNGTRMVYEAACRFLDVRATWVQPRDQVAGNRIEAGSDSSREDALRAIVRAVYDVRTDDASLRSGPGDDTETWPKRFDRLRQEYPGRREFSSAAVNTPSDPQLHEALENLGFRVS
jgi:erythronate-4-phosphate dehydrogenase